MHVYITESLCIYIYVIFHILFHCDLSQDIEYSSLCYTVGFCCLSILYILVCICWPQTPNLFLPYPTTMAPTYPPRNSVGGLPFLHSSPVFVICRIFNDLYSDQCEMGPHCSFACISLIISHAEHLKMCFLAICMSLENAYLGLLPVFQLGCLFCCCWVLCIFWKFSSCQSHHLQVIFSQPLVFLFIFLMVLLL